MTILTVNAWIVILLNLVFATGWSLYCKMSEFMKQHHKTN